MDKEIYFAIVNILDYIAKNSKNNINDYNADLLYICSKLLPYIEGEDSIEKIRAIADANNCGVCDSFEKIIMSFQEQYELGERI